MRRFERQYSIPVVLTSKQSSIGPIRRDVNEPPKYVVLDDRACYEVQISDMHRKTLAESYTYDFASAGKIRARRPHRGRGAIGDPDAPGDEKYLFGKTGVKEDRYYFTGEKDYRPIVYRSQGGDLIEPGKTKPSALAKPTPFRKLLHNQHTRKELLVKNGAQSYSKSRPRAEPGLQTMKRKHIAGPLFDTSRADPSQQHLAGVGLASSEHDNRTTDHRPREDDREPATKLTKQEHTHSSGMDPASNVRLGEFTSAGRSRTAAWVASGAIDRPSNTLPHYSTHNQDLQEQAEASYSNKDTAHRKDSSKQASMSINEHKNQSKLSSTANEREKATSQALEINMAILKTETRGEHEDETAALKTELADAHDRIEELEAENMLLRNKAWYLSEEEYSDGPHD